MLKKLLPYWEDLYALKPLGQFLQEVKNYFDNESIKEDTIRLLHRNTQLEDQSNKGVVDNKEYIKMQSEISTSAFKLLKKISSEYLPILPVKAIAGTDSGPQYAIEYHEIEEWRFVQKVETNGRLGIRVEGKSMEPQYLDGDILVCRKANLEDISSRSSVVVVGKDNTIFLKRVKRKGSKLKLISLNKEFNPFKIHLKEIQELWVVEQKIK